MQPGYSACVLRKGLLLENELKPMKLRSLLSMPCVVFPQLWLSFQQGQQLVQKHILNSFFTPSFEAGGKVTLEYVLPD